MSNCPHQKIVLLAIAFGMAGAASAYAQAAVDSATPVPRDSLGGGIIGSPRGGLDESRGPASATESPTGPGTPGTTGTGAVGAGPTGTMAAPGR